MRIWWFDREIDNDRDSYGNVRTKLCHILNPCKDSIPGTWVILPLLFGCWVVFDSSWTHGLQHTRPPCPSLSPRVCPSSCSVHQWCCLTISSSNALFSFCPQSFPASGTFPMSHLFASDDQNSGASALASVLPVNIQGWSPLRLNGLISLLSKGLSGVFSSTTVQILWWSAFLMVQLSQHDHWEDHSFDYT